MNEPIVVPFDGDGKHPIMIAIAHNEEMGAWDLQILAGNFQSEDDAKKYADAVAQFLRDETNAEMLKAQ